MKTIKIRLNTGALQLGPVPPETLVELECGYLHSAVARGPLGDAFKLEDEDARNRAVISRVAEHIVTGWSVSEPLDRAAVEAFLLALYSEEPGIAAQILSRLSERERFDRPKIIDADDLGNA